MTLSHKIPMIVKPKLYFEWENNKYSELGGYLLNGKLYTENM